MNASITAPLIPIPKQRSCACSKAKTSHWVEVLSHVDPRYGGLSAAVPALTHELSENNNFEVSLAAFCSFEEHFQPSGISTEQISFWPAGRIQWLQDQFGTRKLHHKFRHALEDADGIHIHGLWEQSTSVAANAARSLRIPYVLSAHGMLEPWALKNKRMKKIAYSYLIERKNVRFAACLHALTRAEAEQYIRFGARNPIAIIPNGVHIPPQRDPSLFLSHFPFLRGKRVILFLGRLHPKKGLDLLLRVWSSLSAAWPAAHLVLAGPDAEGTQARLEGLVEQHGLERSVTFSGMLRDELKWSALATAEGFVLPSYSEGLSVAVLEAMGMGVPVIISEACNLPEVQAHRAGWCIHANHDQLASAMGELLLNNFLENLEIGCRGAALVQAQYTWPIVASQMASVYRWMAGGPLPHSVEVIQP